MRCGMCYQRGNGARLLWVGGGGGGRLVNTSWCSNSLQLQELSRLCCCMKAWCAHSSCSQEPAWTTQLVPSISISCGNLAWFLKSTRNFNLAFFVCALLVILSSINRWECGLCNCRNNLLHLTDFFGCLTSPFERI